MKRGVKGFHRYPDTPDTHVEVYCWCGKSMLRNVPIKDVRAGVPHYCSKACRTEEALSQVPHRGRPRKAAS